MIPSWRRRRRPVRAGCAAGCSQRRASPTSGSGWIGDASGRSDGVRTLAAALGDRDRALPWAWVRWPAQQPQPQAYSTDCQTLRAAGGGHPARRDRPGRRWPTAPSAARPSRTWRRLTAGRIWCAPGARPVCATTTAGCARPCSTLDPGPGHALVRARPAPSSKPQRLAPRHAWRPPGGSAVQRTAACW
jgi:hypothetical protein